MSSGSNKSIPLKELEKFESRFLVSPFKDKKLLLEAFRHPSFSYEQGMASDFQRLEFLGDTIVNFVVSECLFKEFPLKDEGELTSYKSRVISERMLCNLAVQFGIEKLLLLGKSTINNETKKDSILADCFEAIFGAYYLDSGIQNCQDSLYPIIKSTLDNLPQNDDLVNYKSILQEYTARSFGTYPVYEVVKEEGEEHNKTFWVEVLLNGKKLGCGSASRKKEAERLSAMEAYKTLLEHQK